MIKQALFFAVLSLSAISPLWAESYSEVLGVSLPFHETLPQTKEVLNLNGHAVVSMFGSKAYVAALYTKQTEKRAEMLLVNDDPTAMVFYFVQDDVTSQMFSKSLTESILVNNNELVRKELDKTRLLELKDTLDRTFNAGDILAIYYSPNNGVLMTVNGEEIRHWPHAKSFFNMLLRTWVGPYPPSRGFKRAILNFPINK